MLLFAQKRVHFLNETEEVMSWILEKVRQSCLRKINECLTLQVPANKENIGFKMYIHVQQVKIGCQV